MPKLEPDRLSRAKSLLYEGYGVEDLEVKMGLPQNIGRKLVAALRDRGDLAFRPVRLPEVSK